jgi:hypothetical protein
VHHHQNDLESTTDTWFDPVLNNTPLLSFFSWYGGGWSPIGPLGTAATNRAIVPALGDYDDGEVGGIIGKGN